MPSDSMTKPRVARMFLTPEDCDVQEFRALVERKTTLSAYPHAAEIVSNIPVYDGDAARKAASSRDGRIELMSEWANAMMTGPGIVGIRRAYADTAPIDEASVIFQAIIAEQHRANTGGSDHFAKPGANDRIWNTLEKLCLRNPTLFAAYHGNPVVDMVCQAWLGPGYQMTAQVNQVNPGGEAQSAHRDYHMGFQTAGEIAHFPAHAHRLSPVLTLQGAIAHSDMPLETGPTLYLPYSQTYLPGYLATGLQPFKDYFAKHHVQLPLNKGDCSFFNPATFHAAGHNKTTNVKRLANLVQVSSAYGRAMETVDRTAMAKALYPVLMGYKASGQMSELAINSVIAASAEGYAFPTNLDRDPPKGGLAPKSPAVVMKEALAAGWTLAKFAETLDQMAAKRLSS